VGLTTGPGCAATTSQLLYYKPIVLIGANALIKNLFEDCVLPITDWQRYRENILPERRDQQAVEERPLSKDMAKNKPDSTPATPTPCLKEAAAYARGLIKNTSINTLKMFTKAGFIS